MVENLKRKEYNPCGDLTGKEREFCDEATKNFLSLPFAEVMRAISVKALAEFEHETNFRNADALKHWADYNQNDIERRAGLNFDTFTPLQAGLDKYFVHLLYENRYNIHYNALVSYCCTLDEKNFATGSEFERLERKIDSLAQEADYSTTVNALNDNLREFI